MSEVSERGVEKRTLLRATLGVALFIVILFAPRFLRARAQGHLSECKSNMKNIGTAYEMYSTDWSGKYPSNMAYLTPFYLKTLPECPAAGRVTYKAMNGPSAPPNPQGYRDFYFLECTGDNHNLVNVPINYPQYNGIVSILER